MALHNTQCPHCFTTYVISDEQYRVSQGMVRCGTCRERFQVRLDTQTSIPKFDPSDVYIEPISDNADIDETFVEEEPTPISFGEIKRLGDTASFSMHSELSLGFSENDDTELNSNTNNEVITEITNTKHILANIHAKELRRRKSLAESRSQQTKAVDAEEKAKQVDKHDPIAKTEESSANNKITHKQPVESQPDANDLDKKLIDQVDVLIEDKLIASITPNKVATKNDRSGQSQAEATDNNHPQTVKKIEKALSPEAKEALSTEPEEPFSLKPKKEKAKLISWLMIPVLCAACAALVVVLMYQLWFRQIDLFDPGSRGDRLVTSVASDLNEQIAKKNVAVPVRRDLSLLELVSARTKPHPTRSSTILLEVALINHAKIAQTMPWLELALYNKEGGLVSRRNLSPNDYAYNNDTTVTMTPREYRRISIELLSFPKSATGYELKLLSR